MYHSAYLISFLCLYLQIIMFVFVEAKTNLVHLITTMRETIADPEKVQGRLARDDRVSKP